MAHRDCLNGLHMTPCRMTWTPVRKHGHSHAAPSRLLQTCSRAGSVTALRMAQLQAPQDVGCVGRTTERPVKPLSSRAPSVERPPSATPSASCDTLVPGTRVWQGDLSPGERTGKAQGRDSLLPPPWLPSKPKGCRGSLSEGQPPGCLSDAPSGTPAPGAPSGVTSREGEPAVPTPRSHLPVTLLLDAPLLPGAWDPRAALACGTCSYVN